MSQARNLIPRAAEGLKLAIKSANAAKVVRHFRGRPANHDELSCILIVFVEAAAVDRLTMQEDVTEVRFDLVYVVPIPDGDDDAMPEEPFTLDAAVCDTLAQDRTLGGAANDLRFGPLAPDDEGEGTADMMAYTRTVFVQLLTLADNPTVQPE